MNRSVSVRMGRRHGVRRVRSGRVLVAVVALSGAAAACSSSESASSSTTTTLARGSTSTTAPVTSAPGTSAPGTSAGGVDCAATQAAFGRVRSLMAVPPSQLAQELPAADREVQVIATQARGAGVPADVVETYLVNQQTQFRNLTQALSAADRSAAVQAAMQQNAALNTPEVTRAEAGITSALTAACPGLATP